MSRTAARIGVCALLLLVGSLLVGRESPIRFADLTSEAGLGAPLDGIMGHAAAWGDIDGDGDADLYVGGFGDRPEEEYLPARGQVPNRLFRNVSDGRFEQISNPAVEFSGRTSDAVFVDLDNDGMLDLYVANNAQPLSRLPPGLRRDAQLRSSSLFRNDHGTFVDVSAASGACVSAATSARSIGVLDYDADGALDLFVLEDRFGHSANSRLCRNLGGFRFADVTAEAGLPPNLFGLGVAIADLNEDARPDIFITHSNRLFMSSRGGGYTEPSGPKATLAWRPIDAEDWPAGAVFGDLNRDGRFDLVVGIHHDRARNRVYLNEGLDGGSPVFRDISGIAGLPSRLSAKSPHVEAQDFDNDGWPDIYFSAAWLDTDGAITPLVFRNLGLKGRLPQFAPLRQIWGEAPLVYFPAGPSGDYDGDGRVDLFLANWFRGNHSRLLRNVSRPNRWLEVGVRGRKMNSMGIGAKVHVYKPGKLNREGGLLGYQEIGTGYGFASGQVPVAHFGLGNQNVVDVIVTFPDGSKNDLYDIQTNRRLTIDGP
jgi:hypothetical protein